MTNGERMVWAAVYAAYWQDGQGLVSPDARAARAVGQADAAVFELRRIVTPGTLASQVIDMEPAPR